jgi:hypothetical protein
MFTAFNLRCLVHPIFLHVTSWIPCLRSFFCMKPLHVLIHTRFLPAATSRSCSATFFVFDRFVRCLVHVPCFLSAAALPLIQATFCHMRSLHGPVYAPFPGCGRSTALFTSTLQGRALISFAKQKTILSNSFFFEQ